MKAQAVFGLILLFVLVIVVVVFIYYIEKATEDNDKNQNFCGTSTKAKCTGIEDCKVGGCSSQVCQGVNEESAITTCEYKDCYNSEKYGFSCLCKENECIWSLGLN